MSAVLVVGSYPPIPVAGAPVTVAEVRRVWAAGDEVTVVSPRLSAAHLAVAIQGPLAGRRLANVRRVTGCQRLVLVMEPGFPVPDGPFPVQAATVAALVGALRGFAHVRVVRAGRTGLPGALEKIVLRAADETADAPAGPTAEGVTVLGPAEVPQDERALRLADRTARQVFGARYPAVRARAERVRYVIRKVRSGRA